MTYTVQQKHKCLKCGHEMDYSPHDAHCAPVVEDFVGCPKCWKEFLKGSIGELQCIVEFGRR